jgi:ATP-binding cassette subfamily B protein
MWALQQQKAAEPEEDASDAVDVGESARA